MKRWNWMVSLVVISICVLFLLSGCAGLQVKANEPAKVSTDLQVAMELAKGGFPNENLGTNEWICEYELEGIPGQTIFAFDPATNHFYFVRIDPDTMMVLEYSPENNSFIGRAFYGGMLIYGGEVPNEEALSFLSENLFQPLHKMGKFNKKSNIAGKAGISI